MSETDFTVVLIDDDPGVLKGLGRLLRGAGHSVRAFISAEAFLAERDPAQPGCVVCDVALPGLDGLRLQAELAERGDEHPIIFISGVGDVAMSVRAIKAGAVDFLPKPVKSSELLRAIAAATAEAREAGRRRDERAAVSARLARLTPRERQVMAQVVRGRLNKQIAADLGTVEKTVKVHRARMMAKLEVRGVADLVLLTARAGIGPGQG
jgi:FixJ family two-component response regulator